MGLDFAHAASLNLRGVEFALGSGIGSLSRVVPAVAGPFWGATQAFPTFVEYETSRDHYNSVVLSVFNISTPELHIWPLQHK